MTGVSSTDDIGEKKASAPDKKSNQSPAPETRIGQTKTKSVKHSKPIVSLVLLCLVVISLAAASYFGWRHWQYQQQRLTFLETQATKQSTQIQQLLQKQSDERSRQEEWSQRLQQNQQAIEQRLDSYGQRIRVLTGTSRDDWLLAEARYLLRLAAQRLLVERSTEGAQALLESADSILQSLNDTAILPIRNAIANELIELKLANNVDLQGIYANINALKDQFKSLPAIPVRANTTSAEIRSAQEITDKMPRIDTNQGWTQIVWQSFSNAINSLKNFVQVRHYDQDYLPHLLISEQQRTDTVNNLLLMLEQAQFALLHQDQEIYEASLRQAQIWWQTHFLQYSEYEVIDNEFSQLQQAKIVERLPDINRSTELLTEYIEQFHRLNQDIKTKNTVKGSVTQ